MPLGFLGNCNSLVTIVQLTSVDLYKADHRSQPTDVINEVTVTGLQRSLLRRASDQRRSLNIVRCLVVTVTRTVCSSC